MFSDWIITKINIKVKWFFIAFTTFFLSQSVKLARRDIPEQMLIYSGAHLIGYYR